MLGPQECKQTHKTWVGVVAQIWDRLLQRSWPSKECMHTLLLPHGQVHAHLLAHDQVRAKKEPYQLCTPCTVYSDMPRCLYA